VRERERERERKGEEERKGEREGERLDRLKIYLESNTILDDSREKERTFQIRW